MKNDSVLNLDQWDVELEKLDDSFRLGVRVILTQPPMDQMLAFEVLKDRVRFARQYRRREFRSLIKHFAPVSFKLLGNRIEPQGFTFETTWGQLRTCLEEAIEAQISIDWIEEVHKKVNPPVDQYFCLRLSFKIEFEGLQIGRQQYDDQLVLIKAGNLAQAKEKLLKSYIPQYETPYCNSDKRLVHWKFVEFVDVYSPTVYKNWDEQLEEGLEVYSQFYHKQLKQRK